MIAKVTKDSSKALLHYFEALVYFKEFENPKAQGMCHNNIGCLYFCRNDFLKAEEHFSKAVKVSE
jgi:tetratricopeptide (TPR) repeat protein